MMADPLPGDLRLLAQIPGPFKTNPSHPQIRAPNSVPHGGNGTRVIRVGLCRPGPPSTLHKLVAAHSRPIVVYASGPARCPRLNRFRQTSDAGRDMPTTARLSPKPCLAVSFVLWFCSAALRPSGWKPLLRGAPWPEQYECRRPRDRRPRIPEVTTCVVGPAVSGQSASTEYRASLR